MLVSEAIEIIRRRVNDEYDTGYSDEDLINYINDAVKYLGSALIVRNDPILTDYMDVDGTTEHNPVPKNFVRLAGGFPIMRRGSNFVVTNGTPIVTIKYFYFPSNVTQATDELPFSNDEALEMVVINLASIYALNKHEFNVQQDEALRTQLEQLINNALGEIQ